MPAANMIQTTIGALAGLALAIFLIIKKVPPVLSLMLGALAGGLGGGLGLADTVSVMTEGVKDVTPAVIRILAAGVLSGVLIVSGAAETIARALIRLFRERLAPAGIALTTMILCSTGVFIDVAVITVAPIALSTGRRLRIPAPVLLLAMIGGGKCGNIISPNPNTLIAAENLHADLPMVMAAGLIPALTGLVFTALLVHLVQRRHRPLPEAVSPSAEEDTARALPPLWASLVAPLTAILLLALRPAAGISIDPLVALPAGGLAGIAAMRQWKKLLPATQSGLEKMAGVAILLIGTGTIAGIIRHSGLNECLLLLLEKARLGTTAIAPAAGALMSAATASTTAGATIASASFAEAILSAGIPAVWGAAMINAGATVLDHLPHGSFFHATGGVCELDFRQRAALIPYETAVGLVLALTSAATYALLG